LGLGVNLSYLEGYWSGTKARHFSDFVNLNQVPARKQEMADIARAGFKTVRIPVCFGAWASIQPPYQWETPGYLAAPDSLIQWALNNNLTAIIDLHHVEFDGSIAGADSLARVVWLWQQIARRYKDTDPNNVLFELRNEPHGITATAWRAQATQLIEAVRAIAPNHTMVVGFHDWNGRDALLQSAPFSDPNLIYTFHFYDPFVFTHQGATWAGAGLPDLKGIPFPANSGTVLTVPPAAKGTWVENAIRNYASEATYDVIYRNLELAKTWSTTRNVPIFLGEFGSYGLNAEPDSRCRHAEAIYVALGKLQIPSTWWEWDGGFSMFSPGTTQLMPCMKAALTTFSTGQLQTLATEPSSLGSIRIFPNPAQETLRIESTGPVAASATITDGQGRLLFQTRLVQPDISIGQLKTGVYWLTVYDKTGTVLGTKRFIK
jgi:endoglucanase